MSYDVEVKIGASTDGLNQGAQQASEAVRQMGSNMKGSFDGMGEASQGAVSSISNISTAVRAMALEFIGTIAIFDTLKETVKVASTFEQLEIRLNAVMGSAQKGQEAFAWIKQFAVDTPYTVESTTKAFMMLKNFGLDPMDGTLKKVADSAAKYGAGADAVEHVTLALGQAWGRGKLQGQDILQLIDSGIPVWDLLAKTTGKSVAELQRMSEKGLITRSVMQQLIDEMGRDAAGASAAQMNSMAGSLSNLQDAYANAVDDIRQKGGFDFIKTGLVAVTGVIPDVVQAFGTLASTVGGMLKSLWDTVVAVFSAISKAINETFGMGSEPMSGMEFFKNVLKVIEVALIGFRVGFETVVAVIRTGLMELVNYFTTFGRVAERAIHLDFNGAKAAYQQGVDNAKAILQQGMDDMVKIATKGQEDILGALEGGQSASGPSGSKVQDHAQVKVQDQQDPTITKKLAEEEIEYERKKAEQLIAIDKQELEKRKSLHQISADDEVQQRISLADRTYQVEVTALQEKVKLYADDKVERKKILDEIKLLTSQHEADVTTISSNAAIERQRQSRDISGQLIDDYKQDAQTKLDIERTNLQTQRDIGAISERDRLQAEQRLAEESYQIELKALQDKLALYADDAQAQRRILNEMESVQRQHAKTMAQINGQIIRDQAKVWDDLSNRIGSLWDKGVQAMMNGTLKWKNAQRAIFMEFVGWFASDVVGKKVKSWIAGELTSTDATTTGVATRTAAETAGAASSNAISGQTSLVKIMNSAWAAMAGAYSAISSIPIVGPFLAPVVAAGVFAGVVKLASNVMSAEGGYDIPGGVNPLVQTHEKEMILPAKYADVIRGMAGGGSSGGGDTHVYVNAMDVKSFRDYFKKNSSAAAPGLRQLTRNFVPMG